MEKDKTIPQPDLPKEDDNPFDDQSYVGMLSVEPN
jgi:hypothetical protein